MQTDVASFIKGVILSRVVCMEGSCERGLGMQVCSMLESR